MIKNQPWEDERHWVGITKRIIDGTNFPKDRVLLCHRGFMPNGRENQWSFRNLPNFEMVINIKKETQLPMIFDSSHVGGRVDKVFTATLLALEHGFDGFIIEVHNNPVDAKTDSDQQLNLEQFDRWLSIVIK